VSDLLVRRMVPLAVMPFARFLGSPLPPAATGSNASHFPLMRPEQFQPIAAE